MPISKRLRHEVMRRDAYTCQYCYAERVPLTIDHIIPRTLGGADQPTNLVVACVPCNAGKTSTMPGASTVDAPDPAALAAARTAIDDDAETVLEVRERVIERAKQLAEPRTHYWLEESSESFAADVLHRRDGACLDLAVLARLLLDDRVSGHERDPSLKEASNPASFVLLCALCCSNDAGRYNVEFDRSLLALVKR